MNIHADWCDPCKILTPKMTELLGDTDEIDLAIVDVEANLDLVETFEVKAVPGIFIIHLLNKLQLKLYCLFCIHLSCSCLSKWCCCGQIYRIS